jgi:hypothetical protein
MFISHAARAAHFFMSPKPVYLNLNDVPIGTASTWWDVATIVSKIVGPSFTAKEIQRYASEGPHGFYVKLDVGRHG